MNSKEISPDRVATQAQTRRWAGRTRSMFTNSDSRCGAHTWSLPPTPHLRSPQVIHHTPAHLGQPSSVTVFA